MRADKLGHSMSGPAGHGSPADLKWGAIIVGELGDTPGPTFPLAGMPREGMFLADVTQHMGTAVSASLSVTKSW